MFELLNWAVAIMDYPEAGHLYDDEIVCGLRFARNSIHHDLADALEPRDVPFALGLVTRAAGGPRIVGPPTVLEWFWRRADELPLGREDAPGQKAYEELLAGEPVEHALAHLNLLL